MLRRFSLPVLLLLISSVYLYTASRGAMLDDGDALYACVAQQMLERNDWVTPYANGVRFLDKPPLMYWLMALSYAVLGTNEFAARLPSVLAVLGTGCLLYFVGRKAGGHASGFIAGVAIAFCVGTFLFTRMVFPDILFVFFLTLALWAFLEWHSDAAL
ncbi:MAG: glycosyl transferase, partial [Acidobacteria bacterium]